MTTVAPIDQEYLRVEHVTTYEYGEPVSFSLHTACLTARSTPIQTVAETGLHVVPTPQGLSTWQDYYDNQVSFFSLGADHQELRVTASCRVSVARTPLAGVDSLPVGEVLDRLRSWREPDELAALEFVMPSPLVPCSPSLAAYARKSLPPEAPLLRGTAHLMSRIHDEFSYAPDVTTVSTSVSEVLSKKHGVCQDFAHVMIACLRSIGAPARYVSGYLVPAEGIVGTQASHAWVSVYCPDVGWCDFDPTNDVRPGAGHVTLAWGRDYADVSPLRGVIQGGGSHFVGVEVAVTRETPPPPA